MRVSSCTVQATPVASGIAVGRVMLLNGGVQTTNILSISREEVQTELKRFHEALQETRKQLCELREKLCAKLQDSDAAIFDAHLMLVEDKILTAEVERAISEDLVNAESAVGMAVDKFSDAFAAVEDAYFQERALDIRDVGGRITANLSNAEQLRMNYDEPRIVIASTLTPSETVGLNREKVLGFAVETGSATSHTAILARSLNLPAVVGVPRELLDSLTVADKLIVDGFSGKVIVNPDAGTEEAYRLKGRESAEIYSQLQGESDLRAVTTDGFSVEIVANVEAEENYADIRQNGASGI
ncbi:MAG: phosphoenolpyruvate--protein phosphotransferase [Lentisphaeria bacterium]|nr:phosphoenolpyruvate--protein phosphotransferase [Lentisphaeria bacterium]